MGDELVWARPRLGVEYRANVEENGSIRLTDDRVFSSPSVAAIRAANVPASDGWYAWRVPRLGGVLLNDLRIQLARQIERDAQGGPSVASSVRIESEAGLSATRSPPGADLALKRTGRRHSAILRAPRRTEDGRSSHGLGGRRCPSMSSCRTARGAERTRVGSSPVRGGLGPQTFPLCLALYQ